MKNNAANEYLKIMKSVNKRWTQFILFYSIIGAIGSFLSIHLLTPMVLGLFVVGYFLRGIEKEYQWLVENGYSYHDYLEKMEEK